MTQYGSIKLMVLKNIQILVAFNKIICLSKSNHFFFRGVNTKKYVKNLFAESISKLKKLVFSLFEPVATTSVLRVLPKFS